ncbi:hypothetical protein [Mycobacterium spongiae]|uniref:Lipoprotein n=1 Tax=Mycobacterium spongiae TaxID=886343 RepID=A0A975PXE7_9MYCO|nr:hypothetical protein [Mycobacterium spongiae]QUR67678.1 hypothetical protein F6B93_11715 [Mycobacterium spongiae]
MTLQTLRSIGARRSATILVAAATTACGPGIGITTGEAPPPSRTSAAPPTLATPANNLRLANAADYFGNADDHAGYYFASPSGRWHCAIVPHSKAGCQSASGSTMGIEGEPDTVAGPDGSTALPNAIVVGETGDAHFAALRDGEFSPDSGPPKVLPFDKVLNAAGFRCNFQESVGVSCGSETTTRGFTFSRDGYTLQYTDVPEDAVPDAEDAAPN